MASRPADGSLASLISAEALAIINRVIAARAAYRAAGLSRRGADALICLGYWSTGDLVGVYWDDRDGSGGLGRRVAGVRGVGPVTFHEVRSFHGWCW